MRGELCFFVVLCIPMLALGQAIDLSGKLYSASGINTENIHVINRTAQRFTITNKEGEFSIPVKLNDTLSFSSIQHKPKEVVVSEAILNTQTLLLTLEEQINQLDEVLVGKVLSGDLMFDVQSTEGDAPINFYDVGIPGYTGRLATQSERRLSEATSGGGIIPLNPIINAITGRTKELKEHIRIEEKDALIRNIRARLSKDFFEANPLDEEFKMNYFYFCMDDKEFLNRCKNKTDFDVLIFLKTKYNQYVESKRQTKK